MSTAELRPLPPYLTEVTTLTPHELAEIGGNAADTTKAIVVHWLRTFGQPQAGFANRINNAIKVTEVNIHTKKENETKREAIVVAEIDVEEGKLIHGFNHLSCSDHVCGADMVNPGGNMHGGCTTFLIDV